jgi:hypothetical protein
LPYRCWVPPVRAPGQDFHLRSQQHARHTHERYALAPFDAGANPTLELPTNHQLSQQVDP